MRSSEQTKDFVYCDLSIIADFVEDREQEGEQNS